MQPTLVAVDPDPVTLTRVERELRDRYGSSYRVACLRSAEDALEVLVQASGQGDEVALVLAADSLPAGTRGELLERVRQLFPRAKRGILVSWAVWNRQPAVEAISDSMALGRIDSYVLRPETSPDEVFHHAVSSFLLDWARDQRLVPHTIHVVGAAWSGRAYQLRETLERCAMPHAFWLAESDQGRELLAKRGLGAKLPVMILPEGQALSDPSDREIAQAAGAPVDFEEDLFDVVIVGAGPAGLSAAVYGASEGLHTLVVDEGGIGGQATSSSLIRNYLGFPKGISGSRLAEQAYEQAWIFGARFVFMHRATALARTADRLDLTLSDDRQVSARAVILAAGASYRRLDIPSLEALVGAGVFYGGAAAEAHALSGKETYIIGGGNSAGQAALHVARYAQRVTLLVRGRSPQTAMSHYLVRQIDAAPNVEVVTDTEVVGGQGEGRLQQLILRDRTTGDERTVAADALFVFIGAQPHTEWLPPEIARDRHGFLLTGEEVAEDQGWPLKRPPLPLETSMPGVFAAGDVRHASGKRVAGAVGEGSIAIGLVHTLLTATSART